MKAKKGDETKVQPGPAGGVSVPEGEFVPSEDLAPHADASGVVHVTEIRRREDGSPLAPPEGRRIRVHNCAYFVDVTDEIVGRELASVQGLRGVVARRVYMEGLGAEVKAPAGDEDKGERVIPWADLENEWELIPNAAELAQRRRTAEEWARAKGFLPAFFKGPAVRKAHLLRSSGLRENPEWWKYAAASAPWPTGKELTEAEFDAAIVAATTHVHR